LKNKIIIIDDEPLISQVFKYFLEEQGYEVYTAGNGKDGMDLIREIRPHAVLTDLSMPEADGFEVMKFVKDLDSQIPVIVISGAGRLDDAVQALRLGAWDYLIKPLHNLDFLKFSLQRVLEKSSLLRENTRYREHLEELVRMRTGQLEEKNRLLQKSRRQIIGILSQAAEYKDFETGTHFIRVSEYAAAIAAKLGWQEEKISLIKLASPVHDIGKIGIPDHILLKKGALTPEEWITMQKHCIYGHRILTDNRFIRETAGKEEEPSDFEEQIIDQAAVIALNHHERWDGTGYPSKLRGKEIPVEARITAVADVFDALSNPRPYKDAWPLPECYDYIRNERGSHFDPEIVDLFLESRDLIEEIKNRVD